MIFQQLFYSNWETLKEIDTGWLLEQPGVESGGLFLWFPLFPGHFTFPVFFCTFISQQSLLEERVVPGRRCKENIGRSLFIAILGARGVCLNCVGKGWAVGGWKDPWKRQRGEKSNPRCSFIKGGFRMQNSLQSWLNVIHCFLLLSVFCTIFLQYIPEWLQWKRNPF